MSDDATNCYRLMGSRLKVAMLGSLLWWAVLFVSPNVQAHHGAVGSPAFYHTDTLIDIEGEITEVLWRNPHVRLRVRVMEPSGETRIWELEGATPNMYRRAGIFENLVGIGDRIRAAGFVSKRNPDSIGLLHLLVPGSPEFVIGNREPLWPEDAELQRLLPGDIVVEVDEARARAASEAARGMFRVWVSPPLTDYELAPPDDRLLTEEARLARETYDAGTDSPELTCETGMPWTMFDPTLLEVIEDQGRIVMRIQEYDVERIIHMDTPPSETARSPLGISIGRWEGDSLVVSTTGVSFPYFDLSGTPQTPQTEFTERFTMNDEENRLSYVLTAVDPMMFREPIIVERFWNWIPGLELEPFECVLWED